MVSLKMATILLWLSGAVIVVLVTMICARRNREAFEG
jgi:cytochrome c-type biogenesis protein CcmH/NrfF